MIFTDFAKAFDKVNHSILINKFHNLGFESNMSSYLSNRFEVVKIGTTYSKKFRVQNNSKVPGLYKKKLVFFCKHFIGRLRNSPLRTEYNDLHDPEDYRMAFLGHPSVWH